MSDNLIIRPLAGTDSIEEITELLHRAYKQLADMGLRYMATHQDSEVTKERLGTDHSFVAEIDGRIIGTITCYGSENTKGSPYLDIAGVGHLGQLGVEPSLQGRGIGSRLFARAEDHAHKIGLQELALDTAESATHLIEWYKRLGYRFIEYAQWDVTNYRSVIMGKRLSILNGHVRDQSH